ncbi:hypothetical protein DBR37_09035 [Herminiimonas sp. KBW02]|uniref:Uncharacterized protein n=1 Tax=Herminiimonas glaciei TaxID=523788 RepID=A0ABW2I9A8_9BURK|nr:hypothetical protein [Herminiimonas sp. KBW02]RQO36443.1 hypothetical protein DBR37_09035 [Herminiimonas sp. KBW02]
MQPSAAWFDYEIVLRDIYRLMLMIEYRANINSPTLNDNKWLNELHQKYFSNEAAHLLVSIASSVRRIQDTEWRSLSADERSTLKGRVVGDKERVGFHLLGSGNGVLNFGLRDACNYIMHAHTIEWHAAGNGSLSQAYRLPFYDLVLESFKRADTKNILLTEEAVYLADDTAGKSWEVLIELNKFLKAAANKISVDMTSVNS